MIWGFLDMLSLTSLQEEARARLCQHALEIFGNHYAARLEAEKRYLLTLLQDNRAHFLEGKQHPAHRRNRLSLLERIMRMRLVFPADDELAAAGAELSAAV
jgi:hypothetical protein